MASFSVRFLGCKVSQTDAQALRERLLRDGHDEVAGRRRCRGRQHLLRHERRAGEVAPSRVAGSAVARPRVRDRLRRAPVGDRLRRPARERHRRPRPDRAGGRDGRRGRGGDRVRPGGRAARPCARIREDPGRLLVLVRVLRDPARPRRHPQPQRRRRARRDPPPRRPGPPRDRAHGREPRLLPRPRGRDDARGADSSRRGDRRRRAAAAVLDRDQPRRRRARCGATRDGRRRAASARAAPVGRRRGAGGDGAALHGRDVPAPARAAGGLQPDRGRDRRLPGRGRRGVRAHARDRAGGATDEGARVSRTRRDPARGRPRRTPSRPR